MNVKKRAKPIDNNIHCDMIAAAEVQIRLHVETEDGQKCFNLFAFLETLEYALEGKEVDGVAVDARQVARYVWCCLRRFPGERAGGNVFRGMPILD